MPLETYHAGLQACPATVGVSVLTAGVTPHAGLEFFSERGIVLLLNKFAHNKPHHNLTAQALQTKNWKQCDKFTTMVSMHFTRFSLLARTIDGVDETGWIAHNLSFFKSRRGFTFGLSSSLVYKASRRLLKMRSTHLSH
jgi:hypothetical protein